MRETRKRKMKNRNWNIIDHPSKGRNMYSLKQNTDAENRHASEIFADFL